MPPRSCTDFAQERAWRRGICVGTGRDSEQPGSLGQTRVSMDDVTNTWASPTPNRRDPGPAPCLKPIYRGCRPCRGRLFMVTDMYANHSTVKHTQTLRRLNKNRAGAVTDTIAILRLLLPPLYAYFPQLGPIPSKQAPNFHTLRMTFGTTSPGHVAPECARGLPTGLSLPPRPSHSQLVSILELAATGALYTSTSAPPSDELPPSRLALLQLLSQNH